jgi:hypothetical protein
VNPAQNHILVGVSVVVETRETSHNLELSVQLKTFWK